MRYNGGMIYKLKTWAVAGLLLAVASGCRSPHPNGVSVSWLLKQDADGTLAPMQSATRDDAWLAKKITLKPMGLMNQSNGLAAMNVVESLASKPLDLEYRVDWLNDDGSVLPYDFVLWHAFTLEPESSRFLGKPVPPVAAGYRLSVRRVQ